MDVEKLISVVYEQKCLWDQSDPNYHLRDLQRVAWRIVSEEMEISVDELKKKWRGLRDSFGKELKKLGNKRSGQAAEREDSKWPYFKHLLFLRNTMSRRDLQSSVPDACEISDLGDRNASTLPSPDPSSELQCEETPKKRFKSPLKKQKYLKRSMPDEIDRRLLEIEEEKLRHYKGNANDPDAQFLMSLLPFLKDVPKHRKLIVRAKLQNVLLEEQNITTPTMVVDSSESTECSVDLSIVPSTGEQTFNMQQQQSSALQQYVSNLIQTKIFDIDMYVY